ncbi:GAF domain-containing protein [Methylobacterium currus]|uniref:GAF domain-containing protein n=1 Tax=Methylobacterium currus TaxID=2051553 RepID=UPI001E55E1B9|nr:GAF domain-containing protein [Methylobacterium currus]UHC19433.1 GAF domain-containing protein [Methylobacterium currus]
MQNDTPGTTVSDPARLAALDALAILDTPPEQGFDDIVRLATRLCATPVALVSLVAADRQWFKARVGFPPCETSLNASVCAHALVESDLLVIPDLTADPRTAANPLVTGEPFIRFYAGAPLRLAGGQVVGSLCVIDTAPRPGDLTSDQADDLRALARQVSALLEMRRDVARRDEVLANQRAELQQARRLDLLAKASSALVAATNPAAVLEPILVMGTRELGFDLCFIYDVDREGRHLRLIQSVGTTDEQRAVLSCVDLDLPLCGIVVRTRRPLVLEAVQASTEPRYALAREAGFNAFAGYPIMSRGQLVGVVSFVSTREPAFDPGALTFFATLARLMSGVRERLDVDAVLRASDTRSRLAQEAAHIGTFEVDVASGLARVSAEHCRIYGVPEAGVYSLETFTTLAVPEDRGIPSTQATIRDGTASTEVEYRIRRANDGALRWISRIGRFVRDDAGVVLRMVGTVQDITARKEAEVELRASEALARENIQRVQLALAAGAIIGTWHWDIPSDRFTIDDAFAHSFGLDPALGRDGIPLDQIVATVHPDDQAGLAAAITEAIARGGAYAHQYRVRRADGRYYWIEANGRVEQGPDGTPLSFPGVLLDVEERRSAQEALRASEAHWRGLFERLSEGFQLAEAIRDSAGDIADFRIIDINPAWTAQIGIPADQVVGHTARQLFGEAAPDWITAFAQVVETGEAWGFTKQFAPNGRWYDGNAFKLEGDRFGVIFLDATARVSAENRRMALLALGDDLRDLTTVGAMTQAAAEIVGRTLGATRAGFGRIVGEVEFIDIEQDWTAPGQVSIAGRHRFDDYGDLRAHLARGEPLVIDDVTTDPRTKDAPGPMQAIGIGALINMPVRERGRAVAVFIVHDVQPRVWTAEELAFLRNVADRVEVGVARVRAEELQAVLNKELAHRLKNTLAIVQSIATQTLRGVSERDLVEAFERRVLALSRAHDVLIQKSWSAAKLRAVMESVLSMQTDLDRFALEGPDMDISPQAALSLSLLLHELATNALKYGALSAQSGMVRVSWRIGGGAAPTLVLDWTETGGPAVMPPRNKGGFGSRLIRMGLLGTREADLDFKPTGLRAEFRAPLAEVQVQVH